LVRGFAAVIAQHGVTEMINNAIDHSEADRVTVTMDLHDSRLLLAIKDDGVGIFSEIARALNLPDERLALLELSKGKFTTDPRNHSGEGVFFTSRMFDNFQIASGGWIFDHDEEDGHMLFDVDDRPLKAPLSIWPLILHPSARSLKYSANTRAAQTTIHLPKPWCRCAWRKSATKTRFRDHRPNAYCNAWMNSATWCSTLKK
jgi:Histidine kinase-like ATPase domain